SAITAIAIVAVRVHEAIAAVPHHHRAGPHRFTLVGNAARVKLAGTNCFAIDVHTIWPHDRGAHAARGRSRHVLRCSWSNHGRSSARSGAGWTTRRHHRLRVPNLHSRGLQTVNTAISVLILSGVLSGHSRPTLR